MERLLASRPLARVFYTSGYTSDTAVRRGLVVAEVAFPANTVHIDAVLRKVREVLDG